MAILFITVNLGRKQLGHRIGKSCDLSVFCSGIFLTKCEVWSLAHAKL